MANQAHPYIIVVSTALVSALWALMIFQQKPLPIQPPQQFPEGSPHGSGPIYYGDHEGNTGYSNRTLQDLESHFYRVDGITHDVSVKWVHSHNDYWRSRPLLDALSLGVKSVEADVWYFKELSNPTIYVGHTLDSLTTHRTLDSLYINPLMAILKGSNPPAGLRPIINDFTKDMDLGDFENEVRKDSGVFTTDSHATLFFLIDFKTDGSDLFDVIHDALEPLRSKGWLTYYDTETDEMHWGPITVIGTGNTPLDKVLNQGSKRDLFIDGPLDSLTKNDQYSINVSPMVSSSLKKLVKVDRVPLKGLSDSQIDTMKQQIEIAHVKGLVTRIWDTPWWPVSLEENVWRQILEAGNDLLNADDLKKATKFV